MADGPVADERVDAHADHEPERGDDFQGCAPCSPSAGRQGPQEAEEVKEERDGEDPVRGEERERRPDEPVFDQNADRAGRRGSRVERGDALEDFRVGDVDQKIPRPEHGQDAGQSVPEAERMEADPFELPPLNRDQEKCERDDPRGEINLDVLRKEGESEEERRQEKIPRPVPGLEEEDQGNHSEKGHRHDLVVDPGEAAERVIRGQEKEKQEAGFPKMRGGQAEKGQPKKDGEQERDEVHLSDPGPEEEEDEVGQGMGDGRERRRPQLPELPVAEGDFAPGVESVVAGVAVFAAAVDAEVVRRVGGQVDEARSEKEGEQQEKDGSVSKERLGVGNGRPLFRDFGLGPGKILLSTPGGVNRPAPAQVRGRGSPDEPARTAAKNKPTMRRKARGFRRRVKTVRGRR